MFNLFVVICLLICAYSVIRSARLLNAAIWLALTSALVSILIYKLGAPEVAAIELSVGAGLVTVLFVFAFSITGQVTIDELSIVPRWLAWAFVLALIFLIGWYLYPLPLESELAIQTDFRHMLWQQRGLDVIVQIVLVFSGVMGLLGLLSESGRIDGVRREKRPSMEELPSLPADSGSQEPDHGYLEDVP